MCGLLKLIDPVNLKNHYSTFMPSLNCTWPRYCMFTALMVLLTLNRHVAIFILVSVISQRCQNFPAIVICSQRVLKKALSVLLLFLAMFNITSSPQPVYTATQQILLSFNTKIADSCQKLKLPCAETCTVLLLSVYILTTKCCPALVNSVVSLVASNLMAPFVLFPSTEQKRIVGYNVKVIKYHMVNKIK